MAMTSGAVPPDHPPQNLFAPRRVLPRLRGIDHGGLQHLPGGIHRRQLAAGAVAGIKADHRFSLEGRRQKQMPQIFREDPDRALPRVLKKIRPQLPLHGGSDQPGR